MRADGYNCSRSASHSRGALFQQIQNTKTTCRPTASKIADFEMSASLIQTGKQCASQRKLVGTPWVPTPAYCELKMSSFVGAV